MAVKNTAPARNPKSPAAFKISEKQISEITERLIQTYEGIASTAAIRLRLGYVRTWTNSGRAAIALERRHAINAGSSQTVSNTGSKELTATTRPYSMYRCASRASKFDGLCPKA